MREERNGGGAQLSAGADALLRPALEAALVVAREGEEETPAVLAPTPLRPFLRFAKLPPRALAATRRVLDGDDEFRARVAEAATEVEVGRAGWLYLTRPDRWEEELSDMVAGAEDAARAQADRQAEHDARRRLTGAQDALRRAESGAEAARAQAAEAVAALADERRARQAAVDAAAAAERRAGELTTERDRARAAAAEAKAELEGLRRKVADLQAERRSALAATPLPTPVAPAPELVAPAPAPVASVPATASPALEEAAHAAAHLADALRTAAAALSGPPMPGAPTASPAGSPRQAPPRRVAGPPPRRPVPLPPAVYDDSTEAADHLVRVPGMVLVVDGYNVSQTGWPDLPIAEQRSRLVDALSQLTARTGADARVVFDGAELAMPGIVPTTPRAVRVSFSPPGVEADDVVLELVTQLPANRPVLVASSDRRVQRGAREAGANVISSSQLLALLGR